MPPSRPLYYIVIVVASLFILFTLYSGAQSSNRLRQTLQSLRSDVKYSATEIRPTLTEHTFVPGNPIPYHNYTRHLLVTRTLAEDISWLSNLTSLDPDLVVTIYTADSHKHPPYPPANKGHEVISYLSFIIDSYASPTLPEILIFTHSHLYSHHNNALLGFSALSTLLALSSPHVIREGYVNLRCHWEEGCPAHLHPLSEEEDFHHMQGLMRNEWGRLFPGGEKIPEVLAQPCCSQFAVSRDRLRSIGLAKWVGWRDWLLRTGIGDYYSGRLWEYLWQFIFTGQGALCLAEHQCYCDAYGVCFGGEREYTDYFKFEKEQKEAESKLGDWRLANDHLQSQESPTAPDAIGKSQRKYDPGREAELEAKIEGLRSELEKRLEEAKERGKDPRNRALECGRAWHDGDGV